MNLLRELCPNEPSLRNSVSLSNSCSGGSASYKAMLLFDQYPYLTLTLYKVKCHESWVIAIISDTVQKTDIGLKLSTSVLSYGFFVFWKDLCKFMK